MAGYSNYTSHIAAIRNDETIGRGSCSVIDESWEDEEITDELKRHGISDDPENIEDAIAHMTIIHEIWKEREQDIQNS